MKINWCDFCCRCQAWTIQQLPKMPCSKGHNGFTNLHRTLCNASLLTLLFRIQFSWDVFLFRLLDRHVANFFILVYQLGICCIYVVFIAENIKSIVDHFTGAVHDVRLFMVIILLPIIFINWVKFPYYFRKRILFEIIVYVFFLHWKVRNLKYLAPFSSLANFITVVSFAILCYYMFREPITLEHKRPVGPLAEFPFFFGTVLFSLEAIGVVSDICW